MKLARLFLLLAFALFPTVLKAHEIRPALLRIEERADGRYDITWKRPVMGDYAVRLVPHITGRVLDRAPDMEYATPAFQLKQWRNLSIERPGLDGRELRIEGLERTITDVLVSIRAADGTMQQHVLRPEHPAMSLGTPASGIAVPAYLLLGVEHILTGYDHLAFVLGLVLLVASRSMLVKTITGFTLAHSVTLGLTTLGIVTVRPALIEALVALSIMFVAVELVHVYRGHTPVMARRPWVVALAFGLLPGCAFAGALAEIGLPKGAVLPSLLLFNLGVEIGQMIFVAAVFGMGWLLSRLPRRLPLAVRWGPPYAIGSLSAFWFIDRIHTIMSAI